MAAGQAQHQIQRRDGVVVVVGIHGGLEALVDEIQHTIQVNVLHLSVPVHDSHAHLGGQIASAAGHAHEATVQNGGTVFIGSHRVGGGQAQVVVAVEGYGDGYGLGELSGILRYLVGEHGAGGVHDGDLVKSRLLQLLALLGQLIGGEQVGLHGGVEGLQTRLFDVLDRLDSYVGVSGIGAHPQEG